ncbi:MAG: hypothetical protein HYZ14_17875 [Bacteroidetes bacterium]|nr:hypothetical protein [Bacteroidota bacterium]
MQNETIFRFYNLRPALPAAQQNAVVRSINPYTFPGKKTPLLKEIESAAAKTSKGKLTAMCATILQNNAAPGNLLLAGNNSVEMLIAWFNKNRFKEAAVSFKSTEFGDMLGGDAGIKKLPETLEKTYTILADVLTAFAHTGKSGSKLKQEIAVAIKLIFIRFSKHEIAAGESVGSALSKCIIALPAGCLDKRIKQPVKRSSESTKHTALKATLKELEALHTDLTDAWNRLELLQEKSNKTVASVPKKTKTTDALNRLPDEGVNELKTSSRNLLAKLKINLRNTAFTDVIDTLERQIDAVLSGDKRHVFMTETFVNLGGYLVNKNKFAYALDTPNESTTILPAALNNVNITATIGDLLFVKQTLKGYRLGEIAHIENVLASEKRERNHRRLNQTTTDFFTETEKEKSTERDLQSTERNEMQSEMSRTAVTELGIDLGVQVSGSYGPSLSFESQLSSGFSSTVEESQQRATTFSKELSEKTAEKIRERVKTEQRKTTLEEIEEVNSHGFENNTAENITGVYRWLDKIYEARVLNYGQRMMLDFIVPEPAAFYTFSMLENEALQVEKPLPPKYDESPLSPTDLTTKNYMRYISAYGVIGAPEPPPKTITVSYFEKQEGSDKADFARSGKIQIPDNYAAFSAAIASYIVNHTNDRRKQESSHIFIGEKFVDTDANDGWDYLVFARRREKEIAFSLHYRKVLNFSAAIDVFCELTPTGLAIWQNKVYEAIMEGYQRKLDEYDEKIAAFNSQRARAASNTLYGSNPANDKRCCNDELHKLAIVLLSNQTQPDLAAYDDGTPPEMNVGQANANAEIIRFFESAFEWNNMAYVLYPYFWGRKSRWLDAIQMHGGENEFTTFLKAGAARVQLAVRPGFERAVAYYLQSGQLWEGNDAPVEDNNSYLPIIEEITENLGLEQQPVLYPENAAPWEISIPTSLVFLQKDLPPMDDTLRVNGN